MKNSKDKNRYYFVDEAGDFTLFNRHGRIIVGNEGVSNFLLVGCAQIPNPSNVKNELDRLREELLSDPYFKDVPSMQPEKKKTALFFHAKDDLPEVRREVFNLIQKYDAKVQVVFRRKRELAEFARKSKKIFGKKLTANDIYDELVKRLFRNLLHKSDSNRIYFARRGKSNRNEALGLAIQNAKRNFELTYRIKSNKPVEIFSAYPQEVAGLQVIDYYLWALQRMLEKREDRFFNMLSKDFRLIMDLDDTRKKQYGEWYSDNNPLTLKKLKPVEG